MANIAPAMDENETLAMPDGELPVEVELPGEDPGIEVEVVPDPPAKHSANLVDYFEEEALNRIGSDLISAFDDDEASRADWLRQYKDGLDYLGFSHEERDQPFKGASGVFHPVMTEAVVRFQSNAIMEIFPAAGPVLTKIIGKETDERVTQALRVKEELNYQLTENMSDFRAEMEQMLFRLPLSGSVFKKTYFDMLTKKPSSIMVPAEDLVVPYAATHLDNAERIGHVLRYSKNKLAKLTRAGLYRKVELGAPKEYAPEGKEKEDKVKGTESVSEKDARHTLIEFHVNYNLPEPFDDPDDVADPYIITVDYHSKKVLGIRRNWAENDEDRKPECYFTHYYYMPGLGFYGTGLIHLMGAIAKASTSILRQLIDAGTLSNLPGGLKTRGLRTKGGEDPIAPGEWRDVDVPAGAIRDNIMPLPYKEPSAVLAGLMQNLIDEGRRIGSIADVEIGSGSENAPVGTTLALMERSLKVMSAVHARLHASLKRELKLIAKVITDYMPPQYDWDPDQEFDRQKDFDGGVDIIPVSDPNAATQAQRIIQMQAVQQLAATAPELYNMKELHRAGLQAIGIKNDERILPRDEDPPRMDPVQENMFVLTAQPIKVYPDQDHQAHITAHMNAMMDPHIMEMVGQSPNAMKVQSQMEAHVAEHLGHLYRQEIQDQMGTELPPMGEQLPPELENRIARMVAEASTRLRDKHMEEQKAKEAAAMAEDPIYQLRKLEVQIKQQALEHQIEKDKAAMVLDAAKAGSKEAVDLRRIESEEARSALKIGADLTTFGAQLDAQTREQGIQLGKEVLQSINDDAKEFAVHQGEMFKHNQQLDHQRVENERNRQHALEIARTKKPTQGNGSGGSGK
jgi:hypothetical protein